MRQQIWQNNSSGTIARAAPVPITLAIPANYTATVSSPGYPQRIDAYTVRYTITPPLIIPADCSATIDSASVPFTQPNIAAPGVLPLVTEGNNRITMDYDGNGDVDIEVPTGLYSFTGVAQTLNTWLRTHNATGGTVGPFILQGVTDFFTFLANAAEQKIIVAMNPAGLAGGVWPAGAITFSFVNPSPVTAQNDSIGPVLGFPTSGAGSSFTTPNAGSAVAVEYAPDVAGFSDTSAYALFLSIISGSIQNGIQGQLLYTFSLGSEVPNTVFKLLKPMPYPVPVAAGTYGAIDVWTTDQAGNRLPLEFYQAPFTFAFTISRNHAYGTL